MARGKVSNDTIEFILKANGSQLQEEIHSTNRHMKELEKQYDDLLKQQAIALKVNGKNSKAYKDLTKQIKEKKQAIAEDKAKIEELTKAIKVDDMTMAQLRKEAAKLKQQLEETSKATEPKEYEELERRLAEVNSRMRDLRESAKSVELSLRDEGKTGLKGFLQNIAGAKVDFGSLKTMLFNSGIKELGMLAGGIIGGGIIGGIQLALSKARAFYNFSVEIEEARRLTREFLNVEGKDLTETSSQLSAIAKQTGREYKEVLGATDTLMQQFGITAEQAYTAIKDGIEAGADENGTLLSQIQQYAPAFRDAGLSVQELIALITQTRSGIFNEQGMALIQTATNRIRTMSTTTQKALDDIGISSQQLQKELTSGDKSIIEAIKEISARIGELPENSREVGEVMKDVFGKTASNEGMKMITTLATIETDMGKLKDVTGEYGSLQREQIDTQAELNRKLTEMFGIGQGGFKEMTAKAEIFILKGLIKTIDYCSNLYKRLAAVRAIVETVRVAFDILFKGLEITIKETLRLIGFLLKELGDIVELVEGVVKGLTTMDFSKAAEAWKHMKNDAVNLWEGFADDAKGIGKRFGENLVGSIQRVFYGKTIKGPAIEGETLDEVTVTPPAKRANGPNGANGTNGTNKSNGKAHPSHSSHTPQSSSSLRQDALAAEQASYQASLQALRKSLADKELTQQEYDAAVLAAATASAENRLKVEREFLQEAQQMEGVDAQEKERRVKEQQRNVAQAEQAAAEARLRQYEQYQKQMEAIERQSESPEERQTRDHLLQLQALQAYYKAARQYAIDHNEDVAAIDEAYRKAQERLVMEYERTLEQKKMQVRQQYGLATQQQLFDQEMAQLRAQYDQKLLTEEQFQRAKQAIQQKYDDQNLQLRQQYGIATQAEVRERERQQLEQQHEEGKLSEEEYQQSLKQLRMDYMKADFDQYAQLFGGAIQALQDAELANIDAKYDAEIEAARQAGEDTTDLENKKANEKLKVQKKYADVNFAIKASQIIADTAVAIMKALGELGPIAGPIAAALMGVTGAAQLAAANAERQKVKNMTLAGATSSGATARVATGLQRGGRLAEEAENPEHPEHPEYPEYPEHPEHPEYPEYPEHPGKPVTASGTIPITRAQDGKLFQAREEPGRRGYVDRPTVIVGDGPIGQSKEWVASNAALDNPTVAPVIDIIDHAQQTGSIATLDMRKYLQAQPLIGRERGGRIGGGSAYPGQSGKTGSSGKSGASGADSHTATPDPTLSRLADILEQGIPAIVALDEIDAQQQRRNQARKIAGK